MNCPQPIKYSLTNNANLCTGLFTKPLSKQARAGGRYLVEIGPSQAHPKIIHSARCERHGLGEQVSDFKSWLPKRKNSESGFKPAPSNQPTPAHGPVGFGTTARTN